MFKKSLPEIISSFTKTMTELDKLVDSNSQEVTENTKRVETLLARNDQLVGEATKATAVREKIAALVA